VTTHKFLAVAALVVVASGPGLSGALGQQQENQALRNSDFAFIGTVMQTGEVSFAGVPASPNNLVVKVDEIVEKPAAAMLNAGDEITVRAADSTALPVGARAVFYARSWIYGKGIAVTERGASALPPGSAPEQSTESAAAGVKQMRAQINRDELRERVKAADAIVDGEVVSVQAAPAPARRVISEHDPYWHDAIVRVGSVVKGGEDLHTIAIRFPASLDVAWYNDPKLRPDQKSIFVLTQDRISDAPPAELNGSKIPTYTALMPQDVLSEDQIEAIKAAAAQ
jgi:hypothetical protein